MTPQEIFDFVVAHLRKQGRKSVHRVGPNKEYEACAYRGDDGCKCAVGCLIPDDDYVVNMECKPVNTLVTIWPKCPVWFKKNINLLYRLQKVHDRLLPDQWEAEFITLAQKEHLNYT